MSDKPKSIYVDKSGQIEIKNKNGFETCVGYDLNSLIFKESDGDNSSVASTVGDSFNNCDINDVDEWFTERFDPASHIDLYTVNEDELEEDNNPTSEEVTTSDIEGYCVIDNFGQLHTIGLVTKNITSEFQPIGEVIRADNLNYGEINTLQCPQQTITLHTDDEAYRLNTSHEQNNANLQPEIVDEVRCILREEFVNGGNNLSELNYIPKTGKINKCLDLINNSNVSDSNVVNISDEVDSPTTEIPIVKVPKKYIISGKIISQNILPLENRNKLSNFTKSVINTTPNFVNNNGRFVKGTSILKCNEVIEKSCQIVRENKVQDSEVSKQTQDICRPTATNLTSMSTKHVNSNVSNSNPNIRLKKSNTPLAVVEISTNKSDDTTEIVIKTEDGENVYKGKTSEMMKAEKMYYTSDNNCDANIQIDGSINNEDDHITKALKSIGIDQNSYEKLENTPGSSVMYLCPVEGCKTTYEKISSMNIHVLCHYNIRPFKCDYVGCSWSFHSNFRLKRHKKTHLKTKNFKCTYNSCERTFTTIYNLRTHLKLHQRPAVLKCSVEGCDETFQTKRTLEFHLKSHGENHAPYVCKIDGCGKCYYSSNSLISHARTHRHTLDELRCDYCYKVFDKPCRLKAHLRVHTGAKPYKCTFEGCEWAFMTSSKLRRHEYKHTQVRNFKCNLCFKSFLRGEHLKDHSMKHFVSKSFTCPVSGCVLNFKNRSSVYAHLKKRHPGVSVSITPTVSDIWPVAMVKNPNPAEAIGQIENSGQTDTPSLDAIEMLADDNIIESFQYNSDDITRSASGAQSISFNGINTESLLVGLPELNYNTQLEQDFNTGITNPTLVTHIVVTESQEDEGETNSFECNADSIEMNGCIGSARTGLTYQETLQDRERRKTKDVRKPQIVRKRLSALSTNDKSKVPLTAEGQNKEPLGLRVASDVVLSAGLLRGSQDNLTQSLLLQDELSSGDLYVGSQVPEEASLLGSSVELLCEDPVPRHSDFEQSTINLRDLE